MLPVLPSLKVARRVVYDLEGRASRKADQLDAMRQKFEAFEASFPDDLAEWAYYMKCGAYRLVRDEYGRSCKSIKVFLCVWLRLPSGVTAETLKQKRNKFDYLARRWAERSVESTAMGDSRRHSRKAEEAYLRAVAYVKRICPQLTRSEQEQFARVVDTLCAWPVQATPIVELRPLSA